MLSERRSPVTVIRKGRHEIKDHGVVARPSGRVRGRFASGECHIVQIVVRDNNVDQALKALKKKMQREGLFREMKRRNHFEKPSERKAREKAEAVRRARKLARKRAQREGLLPKT
jgi:small subunit ribosomal protein S21